MNEINDQLDHDVSSGQPLGSPPAGPTPSWQPGDAWISPAPPVSYQPAYFGYRPSPAPRPASGGRGWIVALVLITALISSSLSAAGVYLIDNTGSHQVVAQLSGSLLATPAPTAAPSVAAPVPADLSAAEDVVRVAAAAAPSVVVINTTGTASNGFRSANFAGSGSGFIVSSDGLIVTNNHVVSGTNSLSVTLSDGRQFTASVIKTDAADDLAVISIKATGLTAIGLGSSASVQVGQLAIAIGNPEGTFAESVTSGVISGLNRSIAVGDSTSGITENLSGLLQTDAAINPGNSGGPLLDGTGVVVGVVTASSANAVGLGFAVPVDKVKALLASLSAS
jgi:S1-C subfamily serine protease